METGNSSKQSLTQLPSWAALAKHAKEMKSTTLSDLFSKDGGRGERLTVEADGLFLDYSKNRVTDETLHLLLALSNETGLRPVNS